jgi:hypothetical protein
MPEAMRREMIRRLTAALLVYIICAIPLLILALGGCATPVQEVALPVYPEEAECVEQVQQTKLPLGAAHLSELDKEHIRKQIYEACMIWRRSRLG